jgi:hypothetical protein
VVPAGVAGLDGPRLLLEEREEPAGSGRDSQHFEVPYEDSLERLGSAAGLVAACCPLAWLVQHPADREMADRRRGDSFGGAQQPGAPGRLIELGQARQDHALVVGPGGFVVTGTT